MRILITGSRDWTDRAAIAAALIKVHVYAAIEPAKVTVVHGDARGADRIAADLAHQFGCNVEAHPADWDRHGKGAGPRRNAEMVAAGADVCLAFPIGASPGTRGCIRLAKQAGIPVTVHEG